ncbi:diacylglycerol/lipid kinase family protein [Sphaerisporangium aureirubrum]|uniref:diacylglycerol/lipid kinase family protein n=1 Tax=Sphaerisporangium aureirubrum TaxID=1544736 RepID=UPI0036272862
MAGWAEGEAMRRLLVLRNPSAGGAGDEAHDVVMAVLKEHADVVEVTAGDPRDLAGLLGEHPGRDPVAVGGDGTLHGVVAALSARGELKTRTVGLVPLGTGNDMARALGIPLEPSQAARVVTGGVERRMDLLYDDQGGIVVNAVHLGVGVAAGQAATALKPVLRRFAYAAGGLAAGVRARGWRVRVEVDGRVLADGRRRVLMVGVGNGTSIGGGTPLTPGARPDDGLADVMVSFSTGPVRRLVYGVLLRLGRHGRQDTVVFARGSRIQISGPASEVNADGEITGPVSGRTWTVTPAAWRITVPSPVPPPG